MRLGSREGSKKERVNGIGKINVDEVVYRVGSKDEEKECF